MEPITQKNRIYIYIKAEEISPFCPILHKKKINISKFFAEKNLKIYNAIN